MGQRKLPHYPRILKMKRTINMAQARFEQSFEQMPEDDSDTQPMFGLTGDSAHSIYGYTSWFYDDDESAFSIM